MGPHYEVRNGVARKYYSAGDVRVAMRDGTTLYFLLSDHLGSTNLTLNSSGNWVTELRYMPYGDTRYNGGGQKTNYRFTGQRWDQGHGLYWYNSRWFDPLIGRFVQADSIVPQPGNPQALNRYSYVLNQPLRYTDPSGHAICVSEDCVVREHPVSGRPLGLKQKYGVVLTGPWETEKAWEVYEGLRAMSERVSQELGDAGGDVFLRQTIGGTHFERWPNSQLFIYQNESAHIYFPQHPSFWLIWIITRDPTSAPAASAWPQLGRLLPQPTIYFFDAMDETVVVHESGHILDYRTGASQAMAKVVERAKSPTAYGRLNPFEDFAVSWTVWVYGPKPLGASELSPDRRAFIESLIVQFGGR